MIRFNTVSNQEQNCQNHAAIVNRVELSQLVNDYILSSDSESDSDEEASEYLAILPVNIPTPKLNQEEESFGPNGDSVPLVTKKAHTRIPNNSNDILTNKLEKPLHHPTLAKDVTMPLARQKVKWVPKNGNDLLTLNSEKTLYQPMAAARGVKLPLPNKKRVQTFPKNGKDLFVPKLNKKSETGSLRKGDSMLLAKKRVSRGCIHENNGHNALW